MSRRATTPLYCVLLVAAAGCAGVTSQPGYRTTTGEPTAEPHTAVGTSHIDRHLTVSAHVNAGNVTVTLAPNGSSETYAVEPGDPVSLTREIHDRGHDVRVVVERDGEVVFDTTVRGYASYDVTVTENDTRVTEAMV